MDDEVDVFITKNSRTTGCFHDSLMPDQSIEPLKLPLVRQRYRIIDKRPSQILRLPGIIQTIK